MFLLLSFGGNFGNGRGCSRRLALDCADPKTASFGDNAYDVFDVDYMSFSMNVKFQPTDPENVIKYLLIDMLTHNYQSMMNYSPSPKQDIPRTPALSHSRSSAAIAFTARPRRRREVDLQVQGYP